MQCCFMRWHWFSCLLVVFLAQTSRGQPTSIPAFSHFSVAEGLASNAVRAVMQDARGFLWVGTHEGLHVYDGYAFTQYPLHTTGTSSTLIESIAELYQDRSGMIWVGTREGLLQIDSRTDTVTPFLHDPGDPASLSHNNVFALVETEPGILWIGTEHGANRLEVETGHLVRYEHDPAQQNTLCANLVTALTVDARGTLWLGTQGGLGRFEPATGGFTCFAEAEANPFSLHHDFIRSLAADTAHNALWIGTQRGLGMLDLETMQFSRIPTPFDASIPEKHRRIIALHLDSSGILWVGSDGGGLAAYDPSQGSWTRQRLQPEPCRHPSNESVRTILEDRTGVLWVGLWDGGLFKERPYKRFTTYPYNPDAPGFTLSHPVVTALHPSAHSEVIWIGTHGGLDVLHPGTGRIEQVQHDPGDARSLSHNEIWALEETRDGDLWIGTHGGGLNRMDPVRMTFEHFRYQPGRTEGINSNTIQFLREDHAGALWMSSPDRGLARLSQSEERCTVYLPDTTAQALSHYSVWPLLESRHDSTLWVGTMGGGLNRYDPATGRFHSYRHDPQDTTSISGNFVQSLYEDEAGDLWIGTVGRGLNRYDRAEGRFYRYTTDDGLPHNTVTCITGGRPGERWIGTLDGLARLDLDTRQVTRFTESDGVAGRTFRENACYEAPDGTLYFGAEGGVTVFRPEQIEIDQQVPPVVLTGLHLFNEPLRLDSALAYKKQVELRYDQNVLTFHFSALHYAAPTENVYAYRLEGVDKDWQQVGSDQRSTTYANLAPGAYTFRVKASNSDGIWNEEGTSFHLAITPPYWRTGWFRLLSTSLVVMLIGLVYLYRRRHQQRLEQTHQRIADDLHDDIGSRLGGLALALDVAAHTLNGTVSTEVQARADEARELLSDLRDTVWIVEGNLDTVANLTDRVRMVAETLFPLAKVDIITEGDLNRPLEMEVRRNLLFFCKEALHNASRHGNPENVRITFEASTDRNVTVRIEDDGKGFDEVMGGGHGLGSLRRRSDALGGTLRIASMPGHGTSIYLAFRL